MKAKAVVRDVGRALDIPLPEVDRLAKIISKDDLKITLDKALLTDPKFKNAYDTDPNARKIIDYGRNLERLPRHASVHASGVVIGDRPLIEHLPLFMKSSKNKKKSEREETEQQVATQFEYTGVEQIGLIKFDLLGLKTLTLIKHCLRLISQRGVKLDMDDIDLEDPETYKLLQSGNLNGVFQMEKQGFKQYIMSAKPKRLEDIICLLALYRPGPLQSGQGKSFVEVTRGRKAPEYLHESLKPILMETHGFVLYQEQVMRITQLLAGFSLGEADLIRRAMGKKKKEDMDKYRPEFIERAEKIGVVDRKTAEKIFDMLESFASYGFNKSHSAAYAMVTFQTAYLKAHYPVEFMAALMTSERDDHDKIAELMLECRTRGLMVFPPDVNSSDERFTVKNNNILFGLGAIKGVGQGAIEIIVSARKEKPFSDLFDFCERTGGGKVNKRAIQALIKSGALDASGGASREVMLASLEKAMKEKSHTDRSLDSAHMYNSLFGPAEEDIPRSISWEYAEPAPEAKRLAEEKEYLGFYVTGHPLGKYEEAINAFGLSKIADVLKVKERGKVRTSGVLTEIKVRKDKKDKDYAFVTLEDVSNKIEVVVWSNTYKKVKDLLKTDLMLVIEGQADPQNEDSRYGSAKILADKIWPLEDELEDHTGSVTVKVPLEKLSQFSLIMTQREILPIDDQRPPFYVRISDALTGDAIYSLKKSPKLTLDLLADAAKVLGYGSFRCSDDPRPPRD
jgi:DNA polymerase-3 subunit alpha